MSKRLNIEFGKNGEGKILMTAVGNTLYLDKSLNLHLKVGDKMQMNDNDFEPLVAMNFYQVQTVDILIEKLIAIKNDILLHSAS